MIYGAIVERNLRNALAALDRGDHRPVLASFGDPVEHTFHGAHALAGTRHSMAGIEPWYARLKRVAEASMAPIVDAPSA